MGHPDAGMPDGRFSIPVQAGHGGADRDRTDDLVIANDALSQLSYGPTVFIEGCGTIAVKRRAGSSDFGNDGPVVHHVQLDVATDGLSVFIGFDAGRQAQQHCRNT